MSVSQSSAILHPIPSHGFVEQHPQLAPFVVAAAMALVAVLVSLAFTGLPAA